MPPSSKASGWQRCWSGDLPAASSHAPCRWPALWLGAILQMVSNLAFVWLYFQPVGAWALTAAIVVENFTGAIGTVIFVAYLSALCGNPLHTATQYALLTALASTGRTFLSSGSGFVVNAIGWPVFFVATASSRCHHWRCSRGCSGADISARWIRKGTAADSSCGRAPGSHPCAHLDRNGYSFS